MKKAGITKIGLFALLVGVAIWWSNSERRHEAVTEYSQIDGSAAFEKAKNPSRVDKEDQVVAEGRSIEDSSYAPYLGNWSDRYPDGEVFDVRLKKLSEHRFRLQSLVKTRSDRIPWVVWEEKLVQDADGILRHFGSVAHMGNVFLTEIKPGQIDDGELAAFMEEHGLYVERRSQIADYVCLGFEDPELGRLEFLVSAFQERFPGVLVEFDTLSYPSATPNDWDPSRMWGLDTIRARDAWTFEKGDSDTDVVVAVIDTGTETSHFDIVENLFVNTNDAATPNQAGDVSGWDFVDDDADPNDDDGHGTHVAGIVGAKGNNDAGAVGVNWGVKLLPLKVGDGDGLRTAAINDALAYVRVLKGAGVNIVATNNSYGSGGSNSSTRNEISQHHILGILFVAAAGNDGRDLDASPDSLEFPAGYTLDNIISVANSKQEDILNVSSNWGTTSVDLSAPGTEIYAPYPGNTYAFLSGTSMASPMVAGAVGLLAQAEPGLTAGQIKARLMQTGDLITAQEGITVTGRRLNLLAALKPNLSGHDIDVSNVSDFVVLFDSVEGDAIFKIDAHPDAVVSASVVFGPSVGRIESLGNRVYRFVPTGNGQAKVRFVSSLLSVHKSVEKTIIVGDRSPVQNGLIHHYAFGGSGNSVEDLGGNSNGTILGATREESEYGPSMRFDATSEKVSFDGQFSNLVTITALVRSDRLVSSPHPRIVNMPFYYLYFSTGPGPEIPDGNRETLKFYSDFTDFGVWNAPPRSIKENQWYFVAATYDSSGILNTPRLYINAESQPVRIQQEPEGTIVNSGGTSYMGNNEENERSFDGLMADIRIYDRELSAIEISDLGASLIQDKWDSVQLIGPSLVGSGALAEFAATDSDELGAALEADWHLEGSADLEVVSSNGATASLRFNESGLVKLVGQVSDGVATRVVVKDLEVGEGSVAAGRYHGTTQSGGIVWLEIHDSLGTGFVTIYDPESGFYRIRESITIGSNGSFRSVENSKGSIAGTALASMSGVVAGYGVQFSGEYRTSPSTETVFAGEYSGGALGVGGDSIRVEVLEDGRVYALRTGPYADVGTGSVAVDGGITFSSARGFSVELQIDGENGVVTGSWGAHRIFSKLDALDTDAILKAGLVGGRLSGSAEKGLYTEFVAPGETVEGYVEEGRFVKVDSLSGDGGPFALLSAGGTAFQIQMNPGENIVEAIADAIGSRGLSLDEVEVDRIRVQSRIAAEAVSAIAFSIVGTEPKEVLIRGLGPSFVERGVEDPAIRLYQWNGPELVELSPNDDWAEGILFTAENENAQGAFSGLESIFEELELESLELDSLDAAQRVWLEPGQYLIIVERSDGAGGAALLELFGL